MRLTGVKGVRSRSPLLLAAIAVAAGGVVIGVTPYPWAPSARADEVTASDNNMRNG